MLQKLQNRKMAAFISSRCIEGDAITKMRIQCDPACDGENPQ